MVSTAFYQLVLRWVARLMKVRCAWSTVPEEHPESRQQHLPREKKVRAPALAESTSSEGTASLAAPFHLADPKVKSLSEHMARSRNETGLASQEPLRSHH